MPRAEFYMAPIAPIQRKKRVEGKYGTNTYRVISSDAEKIERFQEVPNFSRSNTYVNLLGQTTEPNLFKEHRRNRPNTTNVGFLRHDVKLLNEPMCDVRTRETAAEQHRWWPMGKDPQPLKKPPQTLDTTVRSDFQYRGMSQTGNGRHTSNPNTNPAFGSVPINYLPDRNHEQRFWKEGMSYEHEFNSRIDPQYPVRGRRHGAFVWDRYPTSEVMRAVDYFGITKPEDANATGTGTVGNRQQTAEMSPTAQSVPLSKRSCSKDNLMQKHAQYDTHDMSGLPHIKY